MVNKTCSRGKHADYLAQNVLAVLCFDAFLQALLKVNGTLL